MSTLIPKVIPLACVMLAGSLVLTSCATTTEYPSVPAYNYYSVEDVLAMAKQGQSAEQIISKLQQHARGNAFYPLRASELVRLHEQGMPLAVLDYMQDSYLYGIRREERFQLPSRFSGPY